MRSLVVASIVIAVLIAANELQFLGRTGLAIVLMELAVAVGFQGIALLKIMKRE